MILRVGLAGLLAAGAWVVAGFVQTYLGKQIEETKSYADGLMLAGGRNAHGVCGINRLTYDRDDATLAQKEDRLYARRPSG